MTDAITVALRQRLAREMRQRTRLQRMRIVADRCANLLREAGHPVDHGDLLYDERGLPK